MKSFKVSNFRLIDSRGTKVDFKPITVLTGANSSGKSSYVKALVLFRDYLQGILNDYRRDGGYNPVNHKLKFTNPELQLGGFSNTINRAASEGDTMSFSLEISSLISTGSYIITFSFGAQEHEKVLDYGSLQSITVAHNDSIVLHTHLEKNEQMVVDYLNCQTLLPDFIYYCTFGYMPYVLCEDERLSVGYVDVENIMATDRGKRLAALQKSETLLTDTSLAVASLPSDVFNKHKKLFYSDLLDALEKLNENNIIFYFPVLEQFKGKTKEESIQILREKPHSSFSLSGFGPRFTTDELRKLAEVIINGFKASKYESFIDYYRSLEDFVLENVNTKALIPGRWGKSYNFIEDSIIRMLEVSFDSVGFSKRDEKDTIFSVVYTFFSLWEWGEAEAKDKDWMRINGGGNSITELWKESDPYIKRDADIYQFYYHSKHVLYEAFLDYISLLLADCLLPSDLSRLQYNTSSFTSVQRLHSFEEQSHFVKVIQQYLEERSFIADHTDSYDHLVGKEYRYLPDSFLNKWIGRDGLNICDGLDFDVPQGLGFSLILKHNGYNEYLADVGHGITQIISILLQIEGTLIQNEKLDFERAIRHGEIMPTTAIICIEEPEVSLHPCYQSLLADILYDAVKNYGGRIQFVIETHSEYLIRKMQAIVSGFGKDEFEQNPFAVYYFNEDGTIKDLGFKESGRFKESFGPGFFDEAAKSKYLLRMNESQNKE